MESIFIVYMALTLFGYVTVGWLIFSHYRETRTLRQIVQGLISYRFTPAIKEPAPPSRPQEPQPKQEPPKQEKAPPSSAAPSVDQREVETTRKPSSNVPSRIRMAAVEPPASAVVLPPEPAQTAAGLNRPSSRPPPHRPPVKIDPPLPREEPAISAPAPETPALESNDDSSDRPSDGDAPTQVFLTPPPPPQRKPRIISPTLPSMTPIQPSKREP